MVRYKAWLDELPGRPVFVRYPAAFDFMFVYWYLIRFAGASPFSHSALDLKHGIGDAAVEGSRLDLKTATEYVDGIRKFVGYQCQAAFAVDSGALDDVEPLLVDVVAAGANEIEGVDFDAIAKRELRVEARRKAVAAARAKADLYAEAAGVRIGAVLHVEDVDPEQPGASRYRSHAEAAATTAQDLAPGHIVVSAAVILGSAVARD